MHAAIITETLGTPDGKIVLYVQHILLMNIHTHTAIVTEILGTPYDIADRTKLRVVNNNTIR